MIDAISVTQLNNYIKNIFDAEELLHNIPVVGEVFGVSLARNMLYFSLKDENATISCVCFYPALFDEIKEGAKLIITGSPNYYIKGGRFNLNVTKVQQAGLGKLYEEFLKMKQKLEDEGLFKEEHKKSLPSEINRIGVITSKDGAVIQDIKNVAWRRNPSVDIVLYSTKVQGKDAEVEIAKAINNLAKYENIDVIIIARGGGSLEDLSAYNTERVARAVYTCEKPIISAVGHETDWSIIDFVSDLRAPTPSAAAELLTYNLCDKKANLTNLLRSFKDAMEDYYAEHKNDVIAMINRFKNQLELSGVTRKSKLKQSKYKLISAFENYVNNKTYELGIRTTELQKLEPSYLLDKGYAKIEQGQKPLKAKSEINFNQEVSIIFKDGRIKAKPIVEE